jgi:hypothetical protein
MRKFVRENAMSLELSKLTGVVEEMGREIAQLQRGQASSIGEARVLLAENPEVTEELLKKIARARPTDEWRRGAEPLGDRLLERRHPGGVPNEFVLIAADGSQIFPDRHGIALYYLLNTGSIVLHHGSGQVPVTKSDPEVFYEKKDLFDARGSLHTPEYVGLQRGRREIKALADLAVAERTGLGGDLSTPIVALVDGPLLPWIRQEGEGANALDKEIEFTSGQLDRLRSARAIPVGYVDSPTSAYVLRILELIQLPLEAIDREALRQGPYQQLIDRSLFEDLGPNQRSAVFATNSQANGRYESLSGGDRIAFAYVNVSRDPSAPIIGRMEFPRWVADDPRALDTAQAVIYENCVPEGYPYVLARAHELAVVTPGEREHLEEMLMRTLLRNGMLPDISHKARNKLLTGGRSRR